MRLLVVDDEEDVREFLSEYFGDQGDQVVTAADGAAALLMLGNTGDAPIDIVLLDLIMPGDNGIEVARRIRAISQVPIIMLTGRSDPVDRIVGLEIGADDFVAKPFNPRELLARVRAVVRRAQPTPPAAPEPPAAVAGAPGAVRFAGWRLDSGSHALTSPAGAEVALTAAEYGLLCTFLRSPQRVLTREFLLDAAAAGDSFERSIDVQVLRLRRKIEVDPRRPALIKSVRGSGYMLAAKVEGHTSTL